MVMRLTDFKWYLPISFERMRPEFDNNNDPIELAANRNVP
jgi:hypothetical protein